MFKSGSKMAGQKWKEVAENINTYEGFQKNTRDQRSVREHFHKLLADFKAKMRKEESSSGISPQALTATEEILEEITEVMANKPNIEEDEDSKIVRSCSIQSNTDSHSI